MVPQRDKFGRMCWRTACETDRHQPYCGARQMQYKCRMLKVRTADRNEQIYAYNCACSTSHSLSHYFTGKCYASRARPQ